MKTATMKYSRRRRSPGQWRTLAGIATAAFLLSAFARASRTALPADSPDGYELLVTNFETSRAHIDLPRILVQFQRLPGMAFGLGGQTYAIEWTANGQLQSPDLKSRGAKCVERSAAGFWCTALANWFGGPGRYARLAVEDHQYPQAFYLVNLDYNTGYCFRVQASNAIAPGGSVWPWSAWACARTPFAPPIPLAPPQPNVTILPATSGSGVIGGGTQVSALVEWEEAVGATVAVAYYSVQQGDIYGRNWSEKTRMNVPENRGEAVIVFAPGEEPTDFRRFLFRVCAGNVSGVKCSPGRTTTPFEPGPLELKRKKATVQEPIKAQARVRLPAGTVSNQPLPICEAARLARARNSPAAPGLEATCLQVSDLAAKGAAIAEADPTVATARDAESDVVYQVGFDIATGIFGDTALGGLGRTETGPGSLGIREALSASGQKGFDASVKLHLHR